MAQNTGNQRSNRVVPVVLGLLLVAIFSLLFFKYSGEAETAMAAMRITGTLTTEGVECPAMRGDDGQLYTLVGDLGAFKPGDRVSIEGELMLISTCMQGQTIRLKSIQTSTG